MMLSRLNLIAAIALVLVLALLVLTRVDHSRPNYQVNLGDDMTYSPSFTSFESNSNFPNGRTMQAPVPGTIARDTQRFHFEATPQEAIRAGEQLANPFDTGTEEVLASAERGKIVFQFFCTSCHGADAAGNGPVARRGFPPPPSLLTGKSREMKDGQLFHILTFGQNNMPQFVAQLPPDRRWDVINYIRRLQRVESQKPTAGSREPKVDSQIVQPSSVARVPADAESKP